MASLATQGALSSLRTNPLLAAGAWLGRAGQRCKMDAALHGHLSVCGLSAIRLSRVCWQVPAALGLVWPWGGLGCGRRAPWGSACSWGC